MILKCPTCSAEGALILKRCIGCYEKVCEDCRKENGYCSWSCTPEGKEHSQKQSEIERKRLLEKEKLSSIKNRKMKNSKFVLYLALFFFTLLFLTSLFNSVVILWIGNQGNYSNSAHWFTGTLFVIMLIINYRINRLSESITPRKESITPRKYNDWDY